MPVNRPVRSPWRSRGRTSCVLGRWVSLRARLPVGARGARRAEDGVGGNVRRCDALHRVRRMLGERGVTPGAKRRKRRGARARGRRTGRRRARRMQGAGARMAARVTQAERGEGPSNSLSLSLTGAEREMPGSVLKLKKGNSKRPWSRQGRSEYARPIENLAKEICRRRARRMRVVCATRRFVAIRVPLRIIALKGRTSPLFVLVVHLPHRRLCVRSKPLCTPSALFKGAYASTAFLPTLSPCPSLLFSTTHSLSLSGKLRVAPRALHASCSPDDHCRGATWSQRPRRHI